MISELLVSLARCPVCLEPSAAGGEDPAAPGRPRHEICRSRYESLWRCADGSVDKRRLAVEPDGLRCACCGSLYAFGPDRSYLDLRPPAGTFAETTHYAEDDFHPYRAGPLRPPLLSARIKLDMMSRMLRPGPADRVLDIGCGNGRAAFYKRASCGQMIGIDAGDHFAAEVRATVDLARGDIRRLPFPRASFDKAYSLDVLEHLTEDGVRAVLAEARRVLRPSGLFFVYSHVMTSSRIASFQRGVNRLVRWLDGKGLVDNAPERERKSDHRNPLRSYEQLDRLVAEAGFRIERIRYYNVVVKAVVEDLLLPLVEHNVWGRRRRRGAAAAAGGEGKGASAGRPNVGSWAHGPLLLATWLMKLDVALFGRVRTGPFFLLLRATDSR